MDKLSSDQITELINLQMQIRRLEQRVNPTLSFLERDSENDFGEIKKFSSTNGRVELENKNEEFQSKFVEIYAFLENNSTPDTWYICENDGLKCRSLNDRIYRLIGIGIARDDLIAISPQNYEVISRNL